jgi:hypothetical protein
MLDLSVPKVPFDIALPYGLTVTVKPLTTAGMAAAQAAARRAVEAIDRQARERMEAGLPLGGLPDLSGRRPCHYQGPLPLALPAKRRARLLPDLPRGRPALRPGRARRRRAALPLPQAHLDQPAGA